MALDYTAELKDDVWSVWIAGYRIDFPPGDRRPLVERHHVPGAGPGQGIPHLRVDETGGVPAIRLDGSSWQVEFPPQQAPEVVWIGGGGGGDGDPVGPPESASNTSIGVFRSYQWRRPGGGATA